eukprot:254076-Prymnesium_polylepis.1
MEPCSTTIPYMYHGRRLRQSTLTRPDASHHQWQHLILNNASKDKVLAVRAARLLGSDGGGVGALD